MMIITMIGVIYCWLNVKEKSVDCKIREATE